MAVDSELFQSLIKETDMQRSNCHHAGLYKLVWELDSA